MNNPLIIARLTAERPDGVRVICEIHTDATHSQFYTFYTQQGRKTSTKTQERKASRHEGIEPQHAAYRTNPGLDVIQAMLEKNPMAKFCNFKTVIYKKRAYKRAINARADELGKLPIVVNMPARESRDVAGYIFNIPQLKRVSILEGRGK